MGSSGNGMFGTYRGGGAGSIVIFNNSDYLQKARKYGHFTGYKN